MFPCTLSIRKVFRAFWINLHSIYLFNRQNYDRNGFKQREKIILDLEKAKKKNKKRQTNKKKIQAKLPFSKQLDKDGMMK